MVTSEVDMEDTEKKAQDAASHSDTVDSNLKFEATEMNCSAASDGQESKMSLVKCENLVKIETDDRNSNSKSGVKKLINGNNEEEEQKNDSTVDNQRNANVKTEVQCDSNGEHLSNVSSEADGQTNGTSGTEDLISSRCQPEAQECAVGYVKNSSKIESQGPNNAKGDADDNRKGGAETENESKNENSAGELEGDVVLQKKEPITDAAKDDTRSGNVQLPDYEVHKIDNGEVDEVHQGEKMIVDVNQNENDVMVDELKDPRIQTNPATIITDADTRSGVSPIAKIDANDAATEKMPELATPKFLGKPSTTKAGQHVGEAFRNTFKEAKMTNDEDEYEDGDDDGSPADQAAFMRKLESFYRDRGIEFKPLKFYGHPLNCLKLWRSVIRLGGYDRVTGHKLWRQVGESFTPPKTCTTVSWTFRIFYEKALLEYERHKKQSGELQLPIEPFGDSSGVDNEGNGHPASASGGARRDAAARAMQGWHSFGEDKNANTMPKHEKSLKSIGSLKHKRQNEVEHPVKLARSETKQLVTTVVDVGPPADWVKVNVREARDCYEVYALVPGLLREEVRVQTDPAGRLLISGQPGQLDNPWGVTAFKKDVRLPGRINPLETSAVVSLHGRLYVRLPFA